MSFVRLIKASRPIMWVPTVLAYLVGMENFRNFSAYALVELGLFTFPLNFFLYGLNDAYDAETDRTNGRKGDAQGLLISDAERAYLLRVVYVPALVALAVAAAFGSREHAFTMALFVLAALVYSHRAMRTKAIPFLDTLTSAAVYVSPILVAHTTHSRLASLRPVLALLVLPAMGIHAISTVTDYEADRRARVTTVAVFLGKSGACLFAFATFVAPMAWFRREPVILAVLIQSALFALFKLVPDRNPRGERFGDLGGTVFAGLWAVAMLYSIIVHNLG